MNRLLITLAGLAFLVAGATGASAQATEDITIQAEVTKFCANTTSSGTTQKVTVTDGNTGATDTSTKIGVTCNGNSTIAFSSKNGAVTLGDQAVTGLSLVPGFSNFFTYTATATGGDLPVIFTTLGTAAPQASAAAALKGAAFSGDIDVAVAADDPSDPLLAGTYTDVLTVTIAPN